jgi:hypothetical protein
MLFILPILGLPIACCGVVAGVGGALRSRWSLADLRLSLVGIAVCCLALAVNAAIDVSPHDYLDPRVLPPGVAPMPPRAVVPPPAPFYGVAPADRLSRIA